jgi:WXG100 family type VII secretion target
MNEIAVNFGQLQATQEQVAATGRAIDQQLADLRQFLQPVVATWTGSAAETYQAKQAEWSVAAADLNAVLVSVGAALAEVESSYRSTESGNRARWA